MWRITGFLFFNDKHYFLNETHKAFCRERIINFLTQKGIALFDTASAVRRLKDNASDKFLEIVTPTDISKLLYQLPMCHAIATTGERATDTLCKQFEVTPWKRKPISIVICIRESECYETYFIFTSHNSYLIFIYISNP